MIYKKILLSVFSILPLLSFGQWDTWTQLDDVNGAPKTACVGFELAGEGFIALGLDEMFERKQLYSYDVAADDWDNENPLGGAIGSGLERAAAVSFSIGDSAYVGLGSSTGNPYFLDFWVYDYNTGAWSQIANFEGTARRQAVGFTIGNLGYVGTGVDINGNYMKDFWNYDPSINDWTQLNDFGGTARQSAVGFSSGGYGFVGTGDDGVPRDDFWQYDPTLDQWTQKPDMPGSARAGAVGFGFYPQLFVATGYDINFDYTDDVWEFNVDSNYWIQRGNFGGVPRTKAVAFVIGDLAYVGTGYNDDYLDDFWSYEKTHICVVDTTPFLQDACTSSSFTWVDGNTYTVGDGSGPFYHSVGSQEFAGCDSVLSLNLNWTALGTSSNTNNGCTNAGYSWIDGNTYYPTDGTGPWSHTIIGGSANGCDSIATLFLNWLAPDTSAVVNNVCTNNGYTWVDGNTYYPADGTGPWYYNLSGASANGCDSVLTLNLNWLEPDSSSTTNEACSNTGYTWVDGNTYFPTDGTGPWYHVLSGASANGCDSMLTLNVNWHSVDNLTVTNDRTTLTSYGGSGNTFQWIDCDNGNTIIPGETNSTFNPTFSGNYAVILTDSICTDTSDCITFASTAGLTDMVFGHVQIFPNPTSGIVNVDLGNLTDVSVKVYTVTGKLVYEMENINSVKHTFLLDVAAGMYSLQLETKGLKKHYKLITK